MIAGIAERRPCPEFDWGYLKDRYNSLAPPWAGSPILDLSPPGLCCGCASGFESILACRWESLRSLRGDSSRQVLAQFQVEFRFPASAISCFVKLAARLVSMAMPFSMPSSNSHPGGSVHRHACVCHDAGRKAAQTRKPSRPRSRYRSRHEHRASYW